jgi:hypothetical protein
MAAQADLTEVMHTLRQVIVCPWVPGSSLREAPE